MTSSLGQGRFVFLFEYPLFLERCGLRSVTRSLAHSPLKRPRPIIFTIPAESKVATGHLEWKIGHYSYLRPLSRQNEILRPDRLWQIPLAEQLQHVDRAIASSGITINVSAKGASRSSASAS